MGPIKPPIIQFSGCQIVYKKHVVIQVDYTDCKIKDKRNFY